MNIIHHATITFALLAFTLLGCATTTAPAHNFGVSRVTLFDCGLAQLEREAQVSGATDLEIRLKMANLDDMLATLVVASDGGVKVSGVRYPSVFTLGQARAASSFANAAGDKEGLAESASSPLCQYVLALVGTSIRASTNNGRNVEGTVVDCVQSGVDNPEAEEDEGRAGKENVLLVGPNGAMVWLPLDQLAELVPLSLGEGEAIHTYARHLGRAPGLGETAVAIQTAKGSSGRLAAGYIRQAPVWRMSYKVRAHDKGIALEAWGIVHNDSDDDWKDVNLTLVSGLPESYVLSVASPRYAEREAMYTDEGQNMFPQLGAATPDSLLYEESVIRYEYGAGGLAIGGRGAGGGASIMSSRASYGSAGHGVLTGSAAGDSSLLKIGTTAAEEQTEPAVEQEISTYNALSKVTIPARASSMVPLMRRELPGQAFSLVDGSGNAPRTCVHVRNETGLVLQYGAASFYINGRFRGQTELWRAEPGDIQVLCFGEDADVTVLLRTEVKRTAKAVEWKHGNLYVHALVDTTLNYSLNNRAGQARNMAIKVTHRSNGRIVSPQKSLEGEGAERYVLATLPARQEKVQTIVLEEGVERTVPVTISQLEPLLTVQSLPTETVSILKQAIGVLKEKTALSKKLAAHDALMSKTRDSLQRKQNTIKGLPVGAASTSAAGKMVAQLHKTEQRLEKLILGREELLEKSLLLDKKVAEVLATLPSPKIQKTEARRLKPDA